ncbi:tyrosine-type recombinase/integrase [Mesorhizobium abyssinicae]|uniref:tyrosine-type recombinase/integrase n=1 Tax=Mesorhizobium abyssinicae TaxID=1209958 RepID=UPI003399B395
MGTVSEKYLQRRRSRKTGSTSYRYRRAVDVKLKGVLGKGEIVLPLGKTLAAAMKEFPKVHRRVEEELAKAWRSLKSDATKGSVQTPREAFDEGLKQLREWGVNPYEGSDPDDPDDLAEWIKRDVLAEGIAAKYRPAKVYDMGLNAPDHPEGVSPADTELVRLLMSSETPKPPATTLEDAKRLYLKDRFALNEPKPLERKKDEQRAERAVRAIAKALDTQPDKIAVTSITREQARKVQDFIRGEVRSKSTVDRYLNDIRAIIHHAIREVSELHGLTNHFTGLPVLGSGRGGDTTEKNKRLPFTKGEVRQIRRRLAASSKQPDLLLIWRMLEGTGCRLAEVTGLRVADVKTDEPMPYIEVEWHEDRRVKTDPSRRRVPLIGDALEAAKEALQRTKGPMLFLRYGVEGGNTKASAALMKHVREVTENPKKVTHSLRHNMEDALDLAEVDTQDQNLILGHTMGGMAERYGGPERRLEVATRAMRRALLGTA